MTKSIIATHYNKYNKLLKGLENQFMLDNDEIVEDIEYVGKVEDKEDKKASKSNNWTNNRGDYGDGEVKKVSNNKEQEIGKVDNSRN